MLRHVKLGRSRSRACEVATAYLDGRFLRLYRRFLRRSLRRYRRLPLFHRIGNGGSRGESEGVRVRVRVRVRDLG